MIAFYWWVRVSVCVFPLWKLLLFRNLFAVWAYRVHVMHLVLFYWSDWKMVKRQMQKCPDIISRRTFLSWAIDNEGDFMLENYYYLVKRLLVLKFTYILFFYLSLSLIFYGQTCITSKKRPETPQTSGIYLFQIVLSGFSSVRLTGWSAR